MTGPVAASAPPAVSVVVPTCRRPELLARCIGALLRQTLAPAAYEIIVVDDGADDDPSPGIGGARTIGPGLTLLRPVTGHGPAAARNAGWRAARAPVVAFTDDDTVPSSNWLEEGLRALDAEPLWSAAAGRVEVPLAEPGGRRPTDHELMTLGLERADFVTANAFVRRAALQRIGGFDETFTRPWREDSDLQFRLIDEAGPVGRCARAVVRHPVREEAWGVCLRQQRNALFDALLFKKHPRRYRQRIEAAPPWRYYSVVLAAGAILPCLLIGEPGSAAVAALLVLAGILGIAARRLRRTSREPAHVLEMLATSALIPFLSVYWRLRGAWRFRVLFV